MLEINSAEALVLGLWVLGAAAGTWFLVAVRSLRAVLVLVVSLCVPILGSVVALAVVAQHFYRLRQRPANTP